MLSAERSKPNSRDTEPYVLQTTAGYTFAREFVAGLDVADVGCGYGYGSAVLSESAQHVTGIDRSGGAISWARKSYSGPRLDFLREDVERMPAKDSQFQAIVIAHFLEHVEDQRALLRVLKGMLISPGVLFVTTPNRLTSVVDNPYHLRELSHVELERILRLEFSHVEMYSLMMSARLKTYREVRRRIVQQYYALDPLQLRKRVPRRVHQWLFNLATLVGNRLIARAAIRQSIEISDEDYRIVEGKDPTSLDLIAVARL